MKLRPYGARFPRSQSTAAASTAASPVARLRSPVVVWRIAGVACVALLALASQAGSARADIDNWQISQPIPGTQGIVAGPGIDLSGWDSPGHQLEFAYLPYAMLSKASFANSDLTSALLFSSDFTSANLRNANLTNSNLSDSTLTSADFTQRHLHRPP
jgi:Pentapeptide repeats (8 copies)